MISFYIFYLFSFINNRIDYRIYHILLNNHYTYSIAWIKYKTIVLKFVFSISLANSPKFPVISNKGFIAIFFTRTIPTVDDDSIRSHMLLICLVLLLRPKMLQSVFATATAFAYTVLLLCLVSIYLFTWHARAFAVFTAFSVLAADHSNDK